MIIKVEIEGKVYNVSIKDVHSNPVLAEVDGKVYQVFPEVQGPAVIPAVTTQPTPVPSAAPAAPAPAAGNSLTLNALTCWLRASRARRRHLPSRGCRRDTPVFGCRR